MRCATLLTQWPMPIWVSEEGLHEVPSLMRMKKGIGAYTRILLRCDQTIMLSGFYASKDYPEKLRRTRYHDQESGNSFTFLSNNFIIPPLTVAGLYKSRWQVELFFKWIKQHLRIKSFYGTSVNAVKTQIWIAISVYLLVAIINKKLGLKQNLYTILQVFSLTLPI